MTSLNNSSRKPLGNIALYSLILLTISFLTVVSSEVTAFSYIGTINEYFGADRSRVNTSISDVDRKDGLIAAATCGSDPGQVGCWQMEENGGSQLVDGSGYSNNGNLSGTPIWVNGRTGDYALSVNGTQFATVPDNSSIDLTTSITVAAWIRPNVPSTYMYVLTKNVNTGGTAVNGYDLSLTSAHLVRIRFNNSVVLNSSTNYPHDGATWMHIAATWDGTTIRLFLNGVQESNTLSFSGPIQTNSLPLAIGNQNTTDPRAYIGTLDDIRLYNYALSAAQVLALANTPPTVYTISGNAGAAGTVLSYTDGTPKTATADISGNYTFSVPTGWSGTVTPALTGRTFTPANRSYTNVRSNQTSQDYSALAVYTISGNAGLASSNLYYTDVTLKSVTTDSGGNYSITVPSGWSGEIVPSMLGYSFTPVGKNYSNVMSNMNGEDYTAVPANPTYYVDNTNIRCTDAGPGTSPALPFCLISKGAASATAGRTVHVLDGTYAETVYPNSGSAGSPVTFRADPGVIVTGDPTGFGSAFALSLDSYVVIDGFQITNTPYKGIYVDASTYITISNNHVSNAGVTSATHPYEQGIYLRGTTFSTITGNTTDHNTCIGIRLVGGGNNLISKNVSFSNYSVVETDAAGIELTGSSDNTVINNITYSNEDSGINVYLWTPALPAPPVASTNNLIIGNLSYENGDHGIDTNNSPYNTVIGNTVQGNGTVGINFEGEPGTGSHHATVMNNISVGNGFTPPTGSFGGNLRVDSESIAGTVLDYNLFDLQSAAVQIVWDNVDYISMAAFCAAVPGQEMHGLEGDALFISPVASVLRVDGVPYQGSGTVGNYRLIRPSPAIDSADSDAPNQPNFDLGGNPRVDDTFTMDTGSGVRLYDDRGAYEYQPTGPTAASAAISGMVMSADGLAVGNALISLTDLSGATRIAISNPFGYYRFENLSVGETYVVSASEKRFRFVPRIITVNDEVTNLVIIAEP